MIIILAFFTAPGHTEAQFCYAYKELFPRNPCKEFPLDGEILTFNNSTFSANTIGNNQIGLHLESNCGTGQNVVLGPQVRKANQWELPEYTTIGNISNSICGQALGQWAARFDGNDPNLSAFICHNNTATFLPTDITVRNGFAFVLSNSKSTQ